VAGLENIRQVRQGIDEIRLLLNDFAVLPLGPPELALRLVNPGQVVACVNEGRICF